MSNPITTNYGYCECCVGSSLSPSSSSSPSISGPCYYGCGDIATRVPSWIVTVAGMTNHGCVQLSEGTGGDQDYYKFTGTVNGTFIFPNLTTSTSGVCGSARKIGVIEYWSFTKTPCALSDPYSQYSIGDCYLVINVNTIGFPITIVVGDIGISPIQFRVRLSNSRVGGCFYHGDSFSGTESNPPPHPVLSGGTITVIPNI